MVVFFILDGIYSLVDYYDFSIICKIVTCLKFNLKRLRFNIYMLTRSSEWIFNTMCYTGR